MPACSGLSRAIVNSDENSSGEDNDNDEDEDRASSSSLSQRKLTGASPLASPHSSLVRMPSRRSPGEVNTISGGTETYAEFTVDDQHAVVFGAAGGVFGRTGEFGLGMRGRNQPLDGQQRGEIVHAHHAQPRMVGGHAGAVEAPFEVERGRALRH